MLTVVWNGWLTLCGRKWQGRWGIIFSEESFFARSKDRRDGEGREGIRAWRRLPQSCRKGTAIFVALQGKDDGPVRDITVYEAAPGIRTRFREIQIALEEML